METKVLFVGSYYDCRAFCHAQHASYDADPGSFPIPAERQYQVEEVQPADQDHSFPELRIVPTQE